MQKKLHNPKSYTPAVYIPCWLAQVSTQKISQNAKTVYGRLALWSSENGKVFRSAPQLAQELGMSISGIERALKELRDLHLIGTFQPRAGGCNHFEFYDHPWMHEEINSNLIYKSHPPSDLTVPPVRFDGTPPSDLTALNIKEIKRNKLEINNAREQNSDWDNHEATYELARTDQAKQIALSISDSEKSFAAFWSAYPVKKGEGRAKAAWLSQGCHSIAKDILQKLQLQLKKDSQYLEGYIPNPDKYLMEEKWKDDIHIRKKGKVKPLDDYDRNATGWGNNLHEDLFS